MPFPTAHKPIVFGYMLLIQLFAHSALGMHLKGIIAAVDDAQGNDHLVRVVKRKRTVDFYIGDRKDFFKLNHRHYAKLTRMWVAHSRQPPTLPHQAQDGQARVVGHHVLLALALCFVLSGRSPRITFTGVFLA